MNSRTLVFPVSEVSAVGEVRRAASRLAEGLGFTPVQIGEIAIVVTEIASNLVKHVKGGDFILRDDTEAKSLEFFALDDGPGMSNLNLCLQDGFSTASTAGNGLGTLSRLANSFDIYTTLAAGTVVYGLFEAKATKKKPGLSSGGLNLPYPGESVSGDGYLAWSDETYDWAMLLDGLGHGPEAHEAATVGIESMMRSTAAEPAERMRLLHQALARTRGAAVAIARIDRTMGQLLYSAIGNISGQIYTSGRTHGLVSHDGIVGQNARKFVTSSYDWSDLSTLILFSDGLISRARFDEEVMPRLEQRDPQVIAGVLMRSYRRGRDDASVLVLQSQAVRGHPW